MIPPTRIGSSKTPRDYRKIQLWIEGGANFAGTAAVSIEDVADRLVGLFHLIASISRPPR